MAHMTATIHGLERLEHASAVVVIDVIRAFTTAAAAFDAGTAEIRCVEDLDDARALRDATPGALLMGEERGQRPVGFDFGNSPVQFEGVDLSGRVMIQRTTNGTRGLAWVDAPLVLAAAAVNATATALVAATLPPVALMCTGSSTTEDRTCAEHIQRILSGEPAPVAETRHRILAAADEHRAFWTRQRMPFDEAAHDDDVAACAEVDRYPFAMVGRRDGGQVVLTRFDP
jgi:2-phosphosulfolactate phosphatase